MGSTVRLDDSECEGRRLPASGRRLLGGGVCPQSCLVSATAEQVWNALTDADLTAKYWGHANVSDWQPGSPREHRRTDGSERADVVGKVLEADPPTRPGRGQRQRLNRVMPR